MIEDLIAAAASYLPDLNEKRLREAFEFAELAHEGQLRKDGKPYITHPLNAALILSTLHVDEDALIGCLLHDVPEDTEYTLEDIAKRFGPDVAFLVEGITKLSKVYYRHDMIERQVESLKKLFIHSAQDPRVILIKLADRLHNMRTIEAIEKPAKRHRIAKETLEIFVPIANLLGIWRVKSEMEDLCFKVLFPEAYAEIDELVKTSEFNKEDLIQQSIEHMTSILNTKNIPFLSIEGRQKSYYRIYRKMVLSNKSFNELYDIVGLRIIVTDVLSCYQTLGVLHQSFTPKIGRLKDYIAIPKSNGYQSIHTTVFGMNGVTTEFQIRTHEMNLESQYGIAAHYFYAEGESKTLLMNKKYDWVSKILDLQRNFKDNKHFLKRLKLDMFKDRIFVFTPKGDVVDLPQGSTVIDFAYHIHSDVGMMAESALINKKASPLTTKLTNGDTVFVLTSEDSEGPKMEWLNEVQTNLARNGIREFLKEKDRIALMNEVQTFLDHSLKMFGLKGHRSLPQFEKIQLLDHFSLSDWDALLMKLGNGGIDIHEIIEYLYSQKDLSNQEIVINIRTKNRVGLLSDICHELASLHIDIIDLSMVRPDQSDILDIQFRLGMHTVQECEAAVFALSKVRGVLEVTRIHSDASSPSGSALARIEPVQ